VSRIHQVSRRAIVARRRRRCRRQHACDSATRQAAKPQRRSRQPPSHHSCTSSRCSAPAAIFSCCLFSHDDSVVYVRSNPETRKVQCMSCGEFCPQTLKAVAAAKKNQMQNGNSKDRPSLTGEVILDLSAEPSVGSK
jgi:hypothetical protein